MNKSEVRKRIRAFHLSVDHDPHHRYRYWRTAMGFFARQLLQEPLRTGRSLHSIRISISPVGAFGTAKDTLVTKVLLNLGTVGR
jgi:hypothetical protein